MVVGPKTKNCARRRDDKQAKTKSGLYGLFIEADRKVTVLDPYLWLDFTSIRLNEECVAFMFRCFNLWTRVFGGRRTKLALTMRGT
jgi:hypothetical protein